MHALFDRLSAIPGLLITSTICYTLLGLHLTGYRGSEDLADWMKRHRTLVTVLVQLSSQTFGVIHVHVVCALIRSSFILSISAKPFRISTAHFIQAVTAPRMTWDMSWRLTLLLSMMIVASITPAPLWAAAIAPLVASQEVKSLINISTFRVSNASTLWEGDLSTATFDFGGNPQWLKDQGLFSFELRNLQGPLRESASAASVITNGKNSHAKLDKTGFIYEGRSLGAGADAGFTKIPNANAPDSYRYSELGFHANVSCFYNDSMSWDVRLIAENLPKKMWQFAGGSANGGGGAYFTYTAWERYDLFAYHGVYNVPERKIQYQLNTGASETEDPYSFGHFAKIQCDIGLKEETFEVLVNITERLVISRLLDAPPLEWPVYGDAVARQLDNYVGGLSFNDGCSGGCQMGIALVVNINQLFNQTNDRSNATILRGTEEFFASLVDDTLVNLRQTRLVSNAVESTEETTAIVTVPAVVFGDKKFVLVVGILNFIILFAYVFEIIKTRGWAATPPLDIMNDSQVIMAALEGGRLFERTPPDGRPQSFRGERISNNTMLNLQFDGLTSKRPVLMPHLPNDGVSSGSGEEALLQGNLVPGQESIPLVGIFNR